MAVPVTGYTELDLVGFTDKGTYNAATTYVANDLVSYNGIKWKCLQDGTVGVTPAEGVSWSVFIVDNEINDNAVSATSTWSSQKTNTTKADQTAIAPVENGTTASRAYAIGEHFMKDGAFCTAIAAIAQGATFTLDTNYTAGTVGARVADIEDELGGVLDGDLDGEITYANTLKYNVDIKTYTSSSPYTAPCDGYIIASANPSANGAIIMANTNLNITVPANGYFTIFIKKGLTVYGSNLGSIRFRAFNRA